MNYKKIYYQLIEKRQNNRLIKGKDLCESHHIVPKSIGGSNSSDNMVNLSLREHLIAHMLLEKWFYDEYGENDSRYISMAQALECMINTNKYNGVKMTSKLYESIRERYVKSVSGENNRQYNKRGKLSPHYGKKHSEESRKKNSESHKGRVHMHHPDTDVEVVVFPYEIEKYLKFGYVFGVSEHSIKGFSRARKNCKYMFNPITQQQVSSQPKDVQGYLDKGFIFGVNAKNAKNRSLQNSNRVSVYDPISGFELHVPKDDVEFALIAGLIAGRGFSKSTKEQRDMIKEKIEFAKRSIV